jgi:ATP-dependent protease HslVU (ClpYQ) peptidase subunit
MKDPMNTLIRLAGAAAALSASLLLTACGGGDDGPGVVADDFQTLAEGQGVSYALPAATYLVEVTANNHGVTVTWTNGAGCTNSGEVKVYSGSCRLAGDGQVTILNPTVFGLGGGENATIKVTRL